MGHKLRPYLYYDQAVSVCTTCLRRVEASIVIKDGQVFMDKWCPRHGRERVLVADDADYYRMARERFIKPPELPERFNTERRWGCPYDCGLCPEHMQHSCLTLLELTDHCNLRCPICYADSGPHRQGFRDLATIGRMLDAIVANEGEPDVVQLSGGEPTLHPDFFAILDAARARPIRHLMVNTNGLRIAREPEFAARLAEYMPGFELYLQFDSLRDEVHQALRGAKLREVRLRALEQLNKHGVSTTLVVTVRKGLNDGELGEIIEFALQQPCVRGVTFQPIQHAGRAEGFDPAKHRLTLTEVRRRILEQSARFRPEDLIPVPCNPDCLAMAYALKLGDEVLPLTGLIPPETLVSAGRNTIVVERDEELRAQIFKLFATNQSPQAQAGSLSELLCCLPQISAPAGLDYRNVFRVLIMAFVDAHAFDLRAVKKSCVHIVQPDGKIIPFDTFNLFYRDGNAAKLAQLRAESTPDSPRTHRSPAMSDPLPPPIPAPPRPPESEGSMLLGYVAAWIGCALSVLVTGGALALISRAAMGSDSPVVSLMGIVGLLPLATYLGLLVWGYRNGRRTGKGVLAMGLTVVGLIILLVAACFGMLAFGGFNMH